MINNPILMQKQSTSNLSTILIRELVSLGEIQFQFLSTNDQPADILTKATSVERFEWFKKKLKITN